MAASEAEAYKKKLDDLKEYVPFLETVIQKLQINSKDDPPVDQNPRLLQLKKMTTLRELITQSITNKDQEKGLKLATLLKCEKVLLKMRTKFYRTDTNAAPVPNVNGKTVESGCPASPPPQDDVVTQPILIPADRQCSPVILKPAPRKHDHHHHGSKHHSKHKSHGQETGKQHYHNDDSAVFQRRHDRKPTHEPTATPYSPEECWNEVTPNQHRKSHTPSFVDPVYDQSYLDTIYGYRKPAQAPPPSDNVFRRLGDKLDVDNDYENFTIKLSNDAVKARKEKKHHEHRKSSSSSSSQKSAPHITASSIPDVLKSPPLSASDICELLNETMEEPQHATKVIAADLSEIGTRRQPKPDAGNISRSNSSTTTTGSPSLDMVRKKLAMIHRVSPDLFKASPASPDVAKTSIPNERLALKYMPHRRTHHSSTSSNECPLSPNSKNVNASPSYINPPPPTNVNVLPAINKKDPRLRKPEQPIPTMVQAPVSAVSSISQMRSPVWNFATNQSSVESLEPYPIRRQEASAPHHKFPAKSKPPPKKKSGNSSEENWDTDPEEETGQGPQSPQSPWEDEVPDAPNKTAKAHKAPRSTATNKIPWNADTTVPPGLCNKPRWDVDKIVRPGISNKTSWESDTNQKNRWDGQTPKPSNPFTTPTENNKSRWFAQAESRSSAFEPPVDPRAAKISLNPRASQPPIDPRSAQPIKTRVTQGLPTSNINKNSFAPPTDPRATASQRGPWPVSNDPKAIMAPRAPWDAKQELRPQAKSIGLGPRTQTSNTPQENRNSWNAQIQGQPMASNNWKPKAVGPNVPAHHGPNYPPPSPLYAQTAVPPPSPQNSRFNALLNDKSERIKYFESKRQKYAPQVEIPRTYGEFRKAREAQRAAEEAARKAKEPAARKATDGTESTNKPEAPAVEATPSNLDKLYRSSNFNGCDFPKTMTSFKIPKKKTDPEVAKEETSAKAKEKPNETDVVANIIKSIKAGLPKACNSVEQAGKLREQAATTNKDSPKQLIAEQSEKGDLAKVGDPRNRVDPRLKSGKDKMKPTENKSANQTDAQTTASVPKNKSKGKNWVLVDDANTVDVDADKQNKSKGKNWVLVDDANSADDEAANHLDSFEWQVVDEAVITSSEDEAVSKTKQNTTEEAEERERQQRAEQFWDTVSAFQPQRIRARRSTMVDFSSAPIVDKEKLKAANALLYEDLQEQTKKRDKALKEAEEERRHRNLTNMFKKTDDNCTLSTQNIISGKRSTRTTANFNEVQRTQMIFKHRKRELNQDKREKEAEEKESDEEEEKHPEVEKKTKKMEKEAKRKEKDVQDDAKNKEKEAKQKPKRPEKESQAKEEEAKQTTAEEAPIQIKQEPQPPKPQRNPVKRARFSGRRGARRRGGKRIGRKKAIIITLSDDDGDAIEQPPPEPVPEVSVPAPKESSLGNEIMDNFVKDILNPNSDREHLFGLLCKILSDDKLEIIKKIVSAADEQAKSGQTQTTAPITERERSATADEADEELAVETSKLKPKTKKTPKGRGRKKHKKNELDRLNEDIRDMFISEGVLTATGRRMCTLVEAEKARLSPIRKPPPCKEQPVKRRPGRPPGSRAKPRQNQKRRTQAKSTLDSEEESDAERAETPPRRMPVLEPVTPTQQEFGDEDLLNTSINTPTSRDGGLNRFLERKCHVKVAKLKKFPPSYQPHKKIPLKPFIEIVKEEEPDAPKKALKRQNTPDDEFDVAKKARKRLSTSEDKPDVSKKAVKRLTTPDPPVSTSVCVKNTNINWHVQSKSARVCVVCEARMLFPAAHYRSHHSESYISRLAPAVLEKVKLKTFNEVRFSSRRGAFLHYFQKCPFCMQNKRCTIQDWIGHFVSHTGEYVVTCSECHKIAKRESLLEKHYKDSKCKGKPIKDPIPSTQKQKIIRGHVCHLCNFVQMKRKHLDTHYTVHHSCAEDQVESMGYTIELLNMSGVDELTELSAKELEESLQQSERSDQVEIDEDDDGSKSELAKTEVQSTKQVPKETSKVDADDKTDRFKRIAAKTFTVDSLNEQPTAPKLNNSNVFMPTHETNDSPVMLDPFAQSLLNINDDETRSDTHSMSSPQKSAVSIAERLSQRFKDLQQNTNEGESSNENLQRKDSNSIIDRLSQRLESLNQTSEVSPRKNLNSITDRLSQRIKDVQTSAPAPPSQDERVQQKDDDKESSEDPLNTSASSGHLIINESSDLDVDMEVEDIVDNFNDSDNEDGWEDIEIEEPRRRPTAVLAKDSMKAKKRSLIEKFSFTLGAKSNQKPKHHNKPSMPPKRRKTLLLEKQNSSSSEVLKNVTTSPLNTAGSPTPENTQPILGFRPLIANLADLLPDSPSNDPIDLVPELAPSEPLQDLSGDISALLENAENASSNSYQTNIQDALDFVNEQQEQQTIQCQLNIKQIQNVGYTVSPKEFKYFCLFKNCTFLYSNESIGLESHILSEHPSAKWQGYCKLCATQIMGDGSNEFPVMQEIKHMLQQHTHGAPSPVDEKPRIKLRRLTGDCLSNNKTEEPETQAEASQHMGKSLMDLLNSTKKTPEMPPTNFVSTKLADLLQANTRSATTPKQSQPKIVTITLSNKKSAPGMVNTPSTPRPALILSPSQSAIISSPQNTIIGSPQTTAATSPLSTRVTSPQSTYAASTQPARPANAVPLFTNFGNDFMITSVSSGGSDVSPVASAHKQLQITKISSTSVTPPPPEEDIQMPTISNVFSLGAQSLNCSGAIWSQQVEEERVELATSAQSSLEVAQLLENARKRPAPRQDIQSQSPTASKRVRSESPPMVVAETVPMLQATTGDFLITQSVSAQYDTPANKPADNAQLGFNISISNAMLAGAEPPPAATSTSNTTTTIGLPSKSANNTPTRREYRCICKYQTRVAVAMADHLNWHERKSLPMQRDYLRCTYCTYVADDIRDFLKHAEAKHLNGAESATAAQNKRVDPSVHPASSGTKLSGSTEKPTGATTAPQQKTYEQELEDTLHEMVAQTGVPDDKLYRCVLKNCKTPLTEATYHNHLTYHITATGFNPNNYIYKCPHCTTTYHRPAGIKAHMKQHECHRYFCYMCMTTAANPFLIQKHFTEMHWRVPKLRSCPLLTTKDGSNFYVGFAQDLSEIEVQDFGKKLIAEWQRKKAGTKTHYKPTEIELLPPQPIFKNEVFCATCLYKTKVRTNILRHFQNKQCSSQNQQHVDPVNPMPCLETNQKHFDKMTNLASSSLVPNTAASVLPILPKPKCSYVPPKELFKCGVRECRFLTQTEEIFSQHLQVQHIHTLNYNCPHCKEENCKRLSVERILQHLRYHGTTIYQCGHCGYMHYLQNITERHFHEKHSTERVNMIIYTRTEDGEIEGTKSVRMIIGKKYRQDSSSEKAAPSSSIAVTTAKHTDAAAASAKAWRSKLKWACDFCEHQTTTQALMATHCREQHGQKKQFLCVHCPYGATQHAQIVLHIFDRHHGQASEPRTAYHKIESYELKSNSDDMRPLWQRDDPTRIRHIRGIPMEDEHEAEQHRQQLTIEEDEEEVEALANTEAGVASSVTSNVAIPAAQNPSPAALPNLGLFKGVFEFGCCHCDFCGTFEDLKESHFPSKHKSSTQSAKPFFFKVQSHFKCPECSDFTGNSRQLIEHLKGEHSITYYFAADPNRQGLVCGHCNFSCSRQQELKLHCTRTHGPQDIKNLSPRLLESVLSLGTWERVVQCGSCGHVFANLTTFNLHVREKHLGANCMHSEVTTKTLYRCSTCPYTNVKEIDTYRHMIEHYEPFKKCHFCEQSQTSFNNYMQHWYADHNKHIPQFTKIYPLRDIQTFLLQVCMVFPNGLVISKHNLRSTVHGNVQFINQIYNELVKTSRQPPIPRLSIGRLVARKSIEAKQSASQNSSPNPSDSEAGFASSSTAAALQLAGPNILPMPKKITKRRCTVAVECEPPKKAKHFDVAQRKKDVENFLKPHIQFKHIPKYNYQPPQEPYSFYRQPVKHEDLSGVFTYMDIEGVRTRITLPHFKLLFRKELRPEIHKLDAAEYGAPGGSETDEEVDGIEYRDVKKACPRSFKKDYA